MSNIEFPTGHSRGIRLFLITDYFESAGTADMNLQSKQFLQESFRSTSTQSCRGHGRCGS
jgi:hypothetical protein